MGSGIKKKPKFARAMPIMVNGRPFVAAIRMLWTTAEKAGVVNSPDAPFAVEVYNGIRETLTCGVVQASGMTREKWDETIKSMLDEGLLEPNEDAAPELINEAMGGKN